VKYKKWTAVILRIYLTSQYRYSLPAGPLVL